MFRVQLTPSQIWPGTPLSFKVLDEMDEDIVDQIANDKTGVYLTAFNFFDSSSHPLNAREFMQFWLSMDILETRDYMMRFFFEGEK